MQKWRQAPFVDNLAKPSYPLLGLAKETRKKKAKPSWKSGKSIYEKKDKKYFKITKMKIYKLNYPKTFYLISFLIIIIFTLIGIEVILGPIIGFNLLGLNESSWPARIFWLFALIWFWYVQINFAFEIKVSDDNRIEFRGPHKTTVVLPQDIKFLISLYTRGLLLLKHSKGAIFLLSNMDNFHEFVLFLKKSNPNIKIKGC